MLRQESEGEVTQGETECFDRSDRVLPGEPFRREEGMFNWDMPSSIRSTDCVHEECFYASSAYNPKYDIFTSL